MEEDYMLFVEKGFWMKWGSGFQCVSLSSVALQEELPWLSGYFSFEQTRDKKHVRRSNDPVPFRNHYLSFISRLVKFTVSICFPRSQRLMVFDMPVIYKGEGSGK